MSKKNKTHLECMVCGDWKREDQMFSVDVCTECSRTHDKYGNARSKRVEKELPREREPEREKERYP